MISFNPYLVAALGVALGSSRTLSVNTAALSKGGVAATGILESKIIGGTAGRLADAPSTVMTSHADTMFIMKKKERKICWIHSKSKCGTLSENLP